MSGTDFTQTTNYGLYKPLPNADINQWGSHLNANADTIDSLLGPGGAVTGGVSNVRNYGAKGDGTTDDTAAIQAAANAGGWLQFPPGIYQVSAPITVPSNTTIRGDSATLRAATGFPINSPLIINKNYTATLLTDHDIAVFDMAFDYATFGTGGSHCIDLCFVTNAMVVNCTFQCRGAGNATAMPGSYNTLVDGCTAYGFTNCAYDWWWGPSQARLVSSYAETAATNQMINFNPEPTSGPSTGLAASGFVVANCQFRVTGASATFAQLEPLGPGTTVSDVTVINNQFSNTALSLRGGISNVIVTGNIFDGCRGGSEVIRTYTSNGGTPSGVSVIGNVINNPTTVGGNVAAVRIEAASAILIGNSVVGSGWSGYAYSTGTYAALFLANRGSPITIASAVGGPGPPVWGP